MPDTVLVLGTGTEVGKTWTAARLIEALRERGVHVVARKPAQSFDPVDAGPQDAHVLAAATGERPEQVCPPARTFALGLAPPMAAGELGLPSFTVGELVADIAAPPPEADVVLVEGIGGLRSPIAIDGDNLALIELLDPIDIVLVTVARLGAINDAEMARAALAGKPFRIFLNRFDPDDRAHVLNLEWLRARGLRVETEVARIADGVLEAISTSLPDDTTAEDA